MNFDTVIIGGGLAGLTVGIALQQRHKRCVIINNGQSAIDFSTGSMDLLSRLPNGEKVKEIRAGLTALFNQSPNHPYSIWGAETVLAKTEQFIREFDLGLIGNLQQNHLRVTPLGSLMGTWLSSASVPTLNFNSDKAPYDRIAVLGIEGYHDFQPQLLAENLKQQPPFAHCEIRTGFLRIPELDQLRENAREFRSVNIAQLLAHKLAFNDLVKEIKESAGNAEAVFLPACFGLDDQTLFNQLRTASALNLFELPTLPPSLLGIRLHKKLRSRFERAGGLMLNGDRALRAEFDGDRVTRIYTQVQREIAISAPHFVLASGSFFSNGLVADFERLCEPLFNADILQGDFNVRDRLSWTNHRFSAPQPYQSAGVVINEQCQVRKCGRFLQNLYAAGNIIGGYNAIELGCGSGVAVVSALVAAERILARLAEDEEK